MFLCDYLKSFQMLEVDVGNRNDGRGLGDKIVTLFVPILGLEHRVSIVDAWLQIGAAFSHNSRNSHNTQHTRV